MKNRRLREIIKRVAALILVGFITLLASAVMAQSEVETAASEKIGEPKEPDRSANRQDAENEQQDATSDTPFVPTEEISEDQPVAFPIDI